MWKRHEDRVATATRSGIGTFKRSRDPRFEDKLLDGPLGVSPIGLAVQWHPGRHPQAMNDLDASSTDRQAAITLIRRAVDIGLTPFDSAEV